MTFPLDRLHRALCSVMTASLLAAAPALAHTPSAAPATPADPPPVARNAAWWTDASRILAGQAADSGSPLAKLANLAPVKQHRDAFTRSWSSFENTRLKPAMKFAQDEVAPQPQAAGLLFYPFSGPDALYALGMFPSASAMVLVGLEPVGELPDLATLSEADFNNSLAELRASVGSILAYSFFRTLDMKAQFSRNQFSGVTPILLLFIARHGFAVHRADPVLLDAEGTLRESTTAELRTPPAGRVPGLRVTFSKPGEKRLRTLHYFKADLSDNGLTAAPQALKWLENTAPKATYLKSASYLMHAAQFSKIREFILEKTDLIVQDDSGIPLRHFSPDHWERAFFGTYDGPIQLFGNRMQKDLLEAYGASAKPLGFGIGYDHQEKASNIQRFMRKRRSP